MVVRRDEAAKTLSDGNYLGARGDSKPRTSVWTHTASTQCVGKASQLSVTKRAARLALATSGVTQHILRTVR